jgi:hypothetical protein
LVLGEACDLTVVGGLELDRRDVAAVDVQASVVEPVDVLQRLELNVVESAPRPAAPDEPGLVEPDQ